MFNILNGDCLAKQLEETSISGEFIIFREALITGPLQADNLKDFCRMRAEFISKEYHTEQSNYYDKVFPKLEEIVNIPEGSEINLWFEDDLFCQVNLWFCLFLLSDNKNVKIYRIFPKASEKWKGFSTSDSSDLKEAMESRVLFYKNDIEMALSLWKAFQHKDMDSLKKFSENISHCFRHLKEVIDTYLNKNPEGFIKSVMENGITDFNLIFEKFQEEFGALGLGDLQVRKIYKKCI
ncbi:DUF1835 domain-containing protein [Chryseobacterium sp.]|uniref:DUF1835 domain-containing protein n=1 Tax=Chryseobacterium sp. TaxID=1871047 RepID=UPI0025BB561D|nr:DUF1835 domain-containing protein [Chryseobacterium sp.]